MLEKGGRSRYEFDKQLDEIIKIYKDGSEEALDGDETETLSKIILLKIDLNEGNITNHEYEEGLQNLQFI